MQGKKKATMIGLIAVLLWSSIVGLIRGVSESFGATGGAALMYTMGAILLSFTVGFTKVRQFSTRYLIWGSVVFVSYELCLYFYVGYALDGNKAIEVVLVN